MLMFYPLDKSCEAKLFCCLLILFYFLRSEPSHRMEEGAGCVTSAGIYLQKSQCC